MNQGELDHAWPRWPHRVCLRLPGLGDTTELARWLRENLGARGDRYMLEVVAIDLSPTPWPQGREIVVHTRDPEDHAMVLLAWC